MRKEKPKWTRHGNEWRLGLNLDWNVGVGKMAGGNYVIYITEGYSGEHCYIAGAKKIAELLAKDHYGYTS